MKISYILAKLQKKIRGSSLKNSAIHRTSKIESGCNITNTQMQKHSFCGYDCEIADCNIGSFCSIANNVIIGGGMHPVDWVSTSPVFYKGRDSVKAKFSEHDRPAPKTTNIGHDVWIGQYAMIKQGVTIGTGAVVGMGSVVTKDVDPYSIVAGNPAREIKKRFSENIADRLLRSEWWTMDEKRLKEYACDVTHPEVFLHKIGK